MTGTGQAGRPGPASSAGPARPGARLADVALDATVAGGFSRIGLAVRSRLLPEFAGPAAPVPPGRLALVTGATSGLGRSAAAALAGQGMSVHFLARDGAKAGRVQRLLRAGAAPQAAVSYGLADVEDLASVRAFAAEFLARHDRLDVLIHNAGAMHQDYADSPSGTERTVTGHVLAPFLLTRLLLPALATAAPSRVITVSSGGMYAQRLDTGTLVLSPAEFNGLTAYARAKRAQVVLSREWARRTAGRGVAFHAMHPGWADTPGVQSSLPRFRAVLGPLLRTPEQGADTIVWLATAPASQLGSGQFWHDRRPRPEYWLPWTREPAGAAAALWDWAGLHTAG